MDSSRRELLRLCATLSGVGLAGCSSQDDPVSYPTDDPTGTPAASGTPTSTTERPTTEATETTGQPTETEPEPSPTPAAHADLAARTGTIVGEIDWFATEYDDAIVAYRNAINRLLRAIEQIRESADISSHDLERLRNGTGTVARTTQQEITPHFDVHHWLRNPENELYRTVEKFAHRGDWDRADEALAEMYTFYETRQRGHTIDQELSNDPIQGLLLRTMRAESIPGAVHERHDVRANVDPALFEVYHPPSRYGEYAYSEQDTRVWGDAIIPRYDLTAFEQLDELQEGIERTGAAYVVANLRSERQPKRWTYELPNEVVSLQRYVSSAAAVRAVDGMIEAAVSQEGTEDLGGREWRRVYYYDDGDITYAYLLRAGRYLLATAPSRTAWEERREHWTDPLKLTWLWDD
jgi:hypothetical protein